MAVDINPTVSSKAGQASQSDSWVPRGVLAVGGDSGPYRIAAVWMVRDTRRNRGILARYPEVFAAAFTGSSRQWVAALTQSDAQPPASLGLVWCDLRATRLVAWRKP